MVTRLQKFDPIVKYLIDEPIRFIDTARPHIPTHVPEVLRLPNTIIGIPKRSLHQVEHAECHLAICIDPVPNVLTAFILDYRDPFPCGGHYATKSLTARGLTKTQFRSQSGKILPAGLAAPRASECRKQARGICRGA